MGLIVSRIQKQESELASRVPGAFLCGQTLEDTHRVRKDENMW